jgi:monovalent cation:H+ antiporter-2, CPA2 family
VLALVLLPALAGPLGGTAPAPGDADRSLFVTIGLTLLKVAAFVALMLVVGARVLPWVLERVNRGGSRELFTLAVIALSLGLAFGASELFGVSLALGAFFAGVVVHESDLSERAETDLRPLQDTFAALFFVSVGMLFDPAVLLRQPGQILAVVLIIVVGKSLAAFGLVLLLGHGLRTALRVSAALAQIGEFSFILAGLGTALGLLPAEGGSLLVAGALVSIVLNTGAFWAVSRLAPEEAKS